jgi:NDP-sugar pyrophosphorylase family protein
MRSLPEAIVLCGGAGVRLKDVAGNGPKSMARIAGRPFLELLLRQLRRNGFRRVILAVGYQQESIRSHFAEGVFGLQLAYSAESTPLGTGGALRNAADLVGSDSVLILNGDSYTDVDLNKFAVNHRESKADASMVVLPGDGRGDCGSVQVGPGGELVKFEEKQGACFTRYLNAGIYMMSRSILYDIPPGVQVSLERELFPRWLEEGKHIKAFIRSGKCVDIGTPERFRIAQDALANVELEVSVVGEDI